MRSLLSLVLSTALLPLAACTKQSEKFCMLHPADDRCDTGDGGPDGAIACDAQNPCAVGVCENMVCVQCTAADDSECMDDTPVCDTVTNRCEACALHSECDSEACLPSGACGTDSTVAYVSSAGANGAQCGTLAMPCLTITEALMRGRDYVKIKGTILDTVVLNPRNVTIVAEPNASLSPGAINQNAFTVGGGSVVTIHDLKITNGSGTGRGVHVSGAAQVTLVRCTVDGNDNGGISVDSASLTVSRSTISNNDGGGISVSGVGALFDITNTFIFRNGDTINTNFGGATLSPAVGMNRFEFNTIVDNQAQGGSPGGVVCGNMVFDAPNNIIARNTGMQTSTGGCTFMMSKIQTDIAGLNFERPDNAPLSYKLMAGSTAIDQPTKPSDIAVDFDGQPRPATNRDLGADEYMP